ncbi:hypothetical protein ACFOET_02475 [Parapedobacter deserti]|uniref:Uncharacterized protein n=1 Tax=Parapedobacter deserti TaxID=1912957 RepID=A0ABV7JGT1_9SPHI
MDNIVLLVLLALVDVLLIIISLLLDRIFAQDREYWKVMEELNDG